jgi:CBS domain containing-hemolysin-like protein
LEEQVIAAAESGGIDARDREMLRSILRLDVSTVREIMMPRLDMVTVDIMSTLPEVAVSMSQNGHSRLPVYEENIDSIVGIVHSRDLLAILGRGESDKSLREAMRPAFFIPESKRLDALLEELQEKSVQMAIVVDEYGGTEGLVTMEDLLEEIVGEIEDEFSRDLEPEVVRYPDGSALVDAGVTTDEVRALFGAVLDSTDIDTVGGYVYRSLGRIPQAGDIVESDQLRIEVVSILGRRLRKLRINPLAGELTAQKASWVRST